MTLNPCRLPPPVRPGDRIGVAALSGKVDPQRLERGLQALRALGYEPVEAANLRSSWGVFAGEDRERLEAFHDLARDPSISAIIFARGGHGILRVLPFIDWEMLAETPRAFVGYSDVTPFLLEINRRLGWVAFHGPMVAADLARGLSEAETTSFRNALEGRFPADIELTDVDPEIQVRGVLSGGCLSMLTATLGTAFAPEFRDAIFFWEDVGEPWYRLDRMLTHLRLSGTLDRISAMVIGHVECEEGRECRDLLSDWSIPIAWGAPAGHAQDNLTLPLGIQARLDGRGRRLVLGEYESGAS